MKLNKNKTVAWHFSFLLLLSLFAHDLVFARQVVHVENLTTKISRHYLRSFPTTNTPASDTLLTPSFKRGLKRRVVLPTGRLKLAKSTQYKIVLRTIFSDIQANRASIESDLLNYNAWTDLILFCGASVNPTHHLLSRIDKTTTVLGGCALATLLVTPTSDIVTLVNRQRTVQLLLEQPECLTALKQSLESYQSIEPNLLAFWANMDPLYSKEYQDYMNTKFLSADPAVNKIAGKLNRRIFFRNLRDIYGEFIALPILGLLWCEAHFLMTSIAKGGFISGSRSDSYAPLPLFMPVWSIGSTVYNYTHTDGQASLLPFVGAAITNGLAVWRGYCGVKRYQEYSAVFRNLANRMKDVQLFIKTIQQVSNIIAHNTELEATYGGSLKESRALLASSNSKTPTEVGVMVRNFLDMQFDNWSYIRGNGGKLLATYNLFKEHKDCLKPVMYELGQLDSFIGVATLVQEASVACPEHCYTFAKFLGRCEQKSPLIALHAMWNPLLDAATVVDNEVEMDVHQTRNIILCGPNAGGKSAFLSGVASSLLLSQTFGIVPAKSAVITPFNKIHSYIEVGDDIAKGDSLFMVELGRMQAYINMLEQSKPDEFIFTIADEPFGGTNPVESGAVAYSIFSCIAKHTNALHIVASHYPILMNLAHNTKGNGIRNFKVFVKETADRKLHYTYKVVPGEATQTAALKILEEAGYNEELLKQAEYIVKNPGRFRQNFSNGSKGSNNSKGSVR